MGIALERYQPILSMRKTYRTENGRIIRGVSLPIFIHNHYYFLTDLHVFEDGIIDCWEHVDFEGFKQKIRQGWIKTSIPPGEPIRAFPLGVIETTRIHPNRTESELVKEVESIISEFQGEQTPAQICLEAFNDYVKCPSEKHEELLRTAYENVAAHNRKFLLGDMDVDDIPIRAVLFGDVAFSESQKAQIQEKLIRESYLHGINIKKTAANNS